MARGDKNTYNQQEQQSFANAQKQAARSAANQQAAYGQAYNAYSNELANPGYTPAEQQAMTQATVGSLAGAFGAARNRLQNAAARTGNTAGENATEEALARQQGQQAAQAMGGLQAEFGNKAIQGEQNAAAGLGDLYRTGTSAENGALGNSSNLVGTQSRVAITPGFWSNFLGAAVKGGTSGAIGGIGVGR